MRIVQVLMPLGMGGAEKVAVYIHSFLKEKGYDSFVFVGKSQIESFKKHFSLEDDGTVVPFEDKSFFKIISDLGKLLKLVDPDIVHTHARREMIFSLLTNKKAAIVRTQHMAENPKKRVTSMERVLVKKRIDVWVATSEQLKNNYLLQLGYIVPERIFVIYNGVDEEKKKNKEINLKFCIVARLTKQKGIDILLEQINSFSEDLRSRIKLDIYGEGEELENITAYIEKNQMRGIRYCGKTSSPAKILSNYYALLMPSRNEGLPLTMLESMSTMTPVAAHDVGCVREFIDNKINGWIIDENYSWEQFFREALDGDCNYSSIKEKCYETFKTRFSSDTMCNAYLELYKKVVDNHR